MTDKEIDALEEAAERATPGQWKQDLLAIDSVTQGESVASAFADGDAAYIAAANPNTVLSLIGDLRQARKDACEWINIARWLIREFGRESIETEMIIKARYALGYENTWSKD